MMDLLSGMPLKDRDQFKRVCNRLISVSFICKANPATRSDYYFVDRYKDRIQEYLDVLGYRLELSQDYGVAQLINRENFNRLNLKLIESVMLLVLRILFDEKKRELSVSDEVIVNVGDVHDKFMSLQIRNKMLDKTTLSNTLKLFQRFQLLQILDKNVSDEEARLLLYNSLAMAVRVTDIKQAYDKLEIYRKGKSENEKTDQDEAD